MSSLDSTLGSKAGRLAMARMSPLFGSITTKAIMAMGITWMKIIGVINAWASLRVLHRLPMARKMPEYSAYPAK